MIGLNLRDRKPAGIQELNRLSGRLLVHSPVNSMHISVKSKHSSVKSMHSLGKSCKQERSGWRVPASAVSVLRVPTRTDSGQ